ncbi:hypothetical protein KFK09_019451 [Dendrobium nobile]|uniref:Uncharacterized protein n=1 Tax=Dendrobium nobile TaxID=94219 RepID=A0A8T3AQ97_DENNO|nr:hypothetical protein KFK09_019451 [Dendrobium nobile]
MNFQSFGSKMDPTPCKFTLQQPTGHLGLNKLQVISKMPKIVPPKFGLDLTTGLGEN